MSYSDLLLLEHAASVENHKLLSSTPTPSSKNRKQSKNILKKRKPRFGICFDVDGVLARGTVPIPAAINAFRKLLNDQGEIQVPVAFVTNALNRNIDKANQITGMLDCQVAANQMIQAQGPLEVFSKIHEKHCLIIGQGKIFDIAKELGFKKMCTLEDISDAYPLLDMVDHDNRKRVAEKGYQEKEFPPVEAVVLLGEPKRWESSLQLIVDLLRTNGKPDHCPTGELEEHLPVVACNMDLQFMDRATIPRYGHGAYLLCLEALYKKCTGKDLKYTALIGKPSEITFRYAEHVLSREAKRLDIDEPIKRLYMIGDTPEVDIVGSNLYQRYINKLRTRRLSISHDFDVLHPATIDSKDLNGNNSRDPRDLLYIDPEIPASRQIPAEACFSNQTVDHVESLLVTTGIYKRGVEPEKLAEQTYKGHRDFPINSELYRPTKIFEDVDQCIDYILEKELHYN